MIGLLILVGQLVYGGQATSPESCSGQEREAFSASDFTVRESEPLSVRAGSAATGETLPATPTPGASGPTRRAATL